MTAIEAGTLARFATQIMRFEKKIQIRRLQLLYTFTA